MIDDRAPDTYKYTWNFGQKVIPNPTPHLTPIPLWDWRSTESAEIGQEHLYPWWASFPYFSVHHPPLSSPLAFYCPPCIDAPALSSTMLWTPHKNPKLPSQSRIQQPLFYLNGSQSSRTSASASGWCHATSQHVGIRHTTCLNLPSSIGRPSIQSLGIRKWSWGNMS